MKTRILGWALAGAMFAIPAQAAVIYDNTQNDTANSIFYSVGPYTELGDQITLAGTARDATQAAVQFFNLGSAGTFDATLRLYALGSPVGSLLGSVTATGIAASELSNVDVLFTGIGVTLPNSVIFTLTLDNVSSGVDLGLNLYDPPITGISDNTFFIIDSGIATTSLDFDNFYFRLEANEGVPEPSTLLLSGMVLAGFAAIRRRR